MDQDSKSITTPMSVVPAPMIFATHPVCKADNKNLIQPFHLGHSDSYILSTSKQKFRHSVDFLY